MSDLYRIVPYNFDALEPYVIVGRREMLVEVVPDYEAAANAIRSYNPDKFPAWKIAEYAVDAALKGDKR